MFDASTLPARTLLPSPIQSTARQLNSREHTDPWGDVSSAIYDTTVCCFCRDRCNQRVVWTSSLGELAKSGI